MPRLKRRVRRKIKGIFGIPKDQTMTRTLFRKFVGAAGETKQSCFAGDLCRLYQNTLGKPRLALLRSWKPSSANGVGGIKEVVAMVSVNQSTSKLKYKSGAHRVTTWVPCGLKAKVVSIPLQQPFWGHARN